MPRQGHGRQVHAEASSATTPSPVADVEDLSPQPSRGNDRDRLADRANGYVQRPLRLFRPLARLAPCAAHQRDGAPVRRVDRAADRKCHRRPERVGAADPRSGCIFGAAFDARVDNFGVRQVRTSPRSPWQNGYAERWIGTLRRELLDHVIVLGERHLLRLLRQYVAYYNEDRPHMSLGRDAPLSRAVQPPSRGRVVALPRVGGLHHRYSRGCVTAERVFGHHKGTRRRL